MYLAENVVLQHVFTLVGGLRCERLSGRLTAFMQCPPPPQLCLGKLADFAFPINGEHLWSHTAGKDFGTVTPTRCPWLLAAAGALPVMAV